MDDVSRQNAIKALKQTKMEIAGEYGMNYEDAFEIIENASNKGVLEGYFKKKKNLGQGISRHLE